jgi:hypothetical protein
MSGLKLTQRNPGPVAIRKGVEALIAGMNARQPECHWRVALPPHRLKGAGTMGAGQLDNAGVVGPNDERPISDVSATGTATNKDAPDHSREQVA